MSRRGMFSRGQPAGRGRGWKRRERRDRFSSSNSANFCQSPSTERGVTPVCDLNNNSSNNTPHSNTSSTNSRRPSESVESSITPAIASLSVNQGENDPEEQIESMDNSDTPQPPLMPDSDPANWEPNKATLQPQNEKPEGIILTLEDMAKMGTKIQQNREAKRAAEQRKKERLAAVVTFLREYHDRKAVNERPDAPLRRNPSASTFASCKGVTPYSTSDIEPYSIEEMTAHHFSVVFDYITTNNVLRDQVRNLVVPAPETTPARPTDFETAAKIVHSLQNLLAIVQNTVSSFHNLAVLLVRRQPLEIRYTHLMGWIQEVHHSITAILVHRDQLQELTIPRLLSWSHEQDHFRATLQLFNITEAMIKEILQHSSAVTAHATRMIKVLEAHQMVHFMNRKKVRVTAEDEQYRLDSAASMPPTWSDEPSSYIQTLRWWRDNYSNALMIRVTDEYLRISTVDRRLQEQARNSATHQNKTITIPTLAPYSSWPLEDPFAGGEAGHLSTSEPVIPRGARGVGKRQHEDDSSSPEAHLIPVKARRGGSYRQSSSRVQGVNRRFPVRMRPARSGHSWVESCAFCNDRDHYTSDCPSFPYLSSRLDRAERTGLCGNCVKRHYGICIRRDPCSICKEDGHHRTFCLQNPWSVSDIPVPPEQFYDEFRLRTYRNPPPGVTSRRPYARPYRDRERVDDPLDFPENQREEAPRSQTPTNDKQNLGFSPNSDESW